MADESAPADLRDHLALALVPGLGPRLTAALVAHFGTAAAVRQATAGQLAAVPQIGRKLAEKFAEGLRSANVDAEWELLRRHGVVPVSLGSADYPALLAAVPDPPPLLYRRGTLLPDDVRAVGVVGSRSCTGYGLRMAERIAAGLARAGWVVVSGLARGIDAAAHRGALEAGGRTIAVLAGGLSSIYPPEHADLADRVAAQGALLTETPMTVAPQPGMFPARNRIISGLSRGVVVVEAGSRSGALITVEHAAEQGREVFAVPGNADSPASGGCLELIRKGARLVRSADDILEDVAGLSPVDAKASGTSDPQRSPSPNLFDAPSPATPASPPPGLDDTQRRAWDALTTAKHADDLSRELGLSPGELSVVLMKLEVMKVVRRLAGNRFERQG